MNREKAEGWHPTPNQGLISITDDSYDPADLHPGWKFLLRVGFHDVDADQVAFIPEKIAETTLLTDEKAGLIAEWLTALHSLPEEIELIVHCQAGISRSAGVAMAAAVHFGLPFDEGYRDFNRLVFRKVLAQFKVR